MSEPDAPTSTSPRSTAALRPAGATGASGTVTTDRPTADGDPDDGVADASLEEVRPVRRSTRVRTRRRWPGRIVMGIAIVACGLLAFGTLTGRFKVLTVPTGSMNPTIPTGAGIVVRAQSTEDVEVGQIIVFHAPVTNVLTVHRVISIGHRDGRPVVRTKGDNNPVPDPWRARLDGPTVYRVAAVVPGMGEVTERLGPTPARLALAAASALCVLIAGLRLIWRPDGPATPTAPVTTGDPADAGRRPRPGRQRQLSRRRRRRVAGVGALGLLAVTGAAVGAERADATFIGTTNSPGPAASGALATPNPATCTWTSTTALAVNWTLPGGGIQTGASVIRTTLAGATPTSVATVTPATVGTATVNAPTPVTTPYRYAVQTTKSPWTSALSTNVRSDDCTDTIVPFAGTGTAGATGDNGAATAATLSQPRHLAVAPDGSTYIADTANSRIRKVDAAGTITTFAGGPAASACTYTGAVSGLGLNAPRGVAVDSSGNVYIADSGAACVRKVDTAGNVTRVAGGGASTTCTNTTVAASALSLSTPSSVAVTGTGDLIVADTGRNCIRRISGGNATLVAGGGATTTCTTATMANTAVSLSAPADVAVTSAGDVIIADTSRNCIRRVSGTTVSHVLGGGATTTCTASGTASTISISLPESVTVDMVGRIIVADTGRRCLRLVNGTTASQVAFTGTSGTTGDSGPAFAALVGSPAGLALQSDGDLLVSDRLSTAGGNRVRLIRNPLP